MGRKTSGLAAEQPPPALFISHKTNKSGGSTSGSTQMVNISGVWDYVINKTDISSWYEHFAISSKFTNQKFVFSSKADTWSYESLLNCSFLFQWSLFTNVAAIIATNTLYKMYFVWELILYFKLRTHILIMYYSLSTNICIHIFFVTARLFVCFFLRLVCIIRNHWTVGQTDFEQ